MIVNLFRKDLKNEPIEALYRRVVEASRRPHLYESLGIPDTAEGRFESLTLHAVLVLRRLKALPAPADDVGQSFVDVLFRELDAALRVLGVGDLSVGKRIKKLAQAFYGRAASYEAALAASIGEALEEALVRNVLGENGRPAELAADIRHLDATLATWSLDDLLDPAREIAPAGEGSAK